MSLTRFQPPAEGISEAVIAGIAVWAQEGSMAVDGGSGQNRHRFAQGYLYEPTYRSHYVGVTVDPPSFAIEPFIP